MAVSYDVTTTSSTAEVTIYNIYTIPQSGYTITLQIFLNNNFVEWVEDIDISWLINYNYVYTNLSPNTTYSFDIDFWEDRTVVDTIHGTFTTESSGGGGGVDAYWDYTYTNSSVTIDVHNASGYYVSYYLRDRTNGITVFDGEIDGRVWDKFYTISNLSSNTNYRLYVSLSEYSSGGSLIDIYSSDDNLYEDFTTGGGGGGGGEDQWNLSYRGEFYPSTSMTLETLSGGIAEKTVYLYWLYFNDNATVTFFTSGSGDTIGYLSANNQDSFDYDNGVPYYSITDDDDSGDNRNFSITNYNVTANTGYYLWVKTYQGSEYSGSVSVSITMSGGSSTQWDYVNYNLGSISSADTRSYSITPYYLNRILFSPTTSGTLQVSSTGSTDVIAYLTANTGFDVDTGIPTADASPITITGDTGTSGVNMNFSASVTANTTYYLWVRGYSTSDSGTTQVTISPPAAWGVSTVSGGNNLNQTLMLETVNLYAKTLTRIQFSIRKAGSVRFYSTGQSNVQVYLSTSTGYNNSTGVPNSGTITLSGNTGTSTNNFDCTATLSTGTTYYLWVRGVLESTSGSICVVIVPPTGGSVSGNGQTYIYSYGSWLEATPYIFVWNYNTNSGSWVEATPGIYVNGSWI